MISEKGLKDRAKFYCETLFHVPLKIDVRFFEEEEERMTALGFFRATNDYGSLIPLEGDDADEDFFIGINSKIATNREHVLTDTLLHELLHYALWYRGGEYGDKDEDFIQNAKKLGISNNYERDYTRKDKMTGCYYFKNDVEKLKIYEKMYANARIH